MVDNLWNSEKFKQIPALDGLVYRSNLLGLDRSIANMYGGNTSAKIQMPDHMNKPVDVLYVKGSGSDMASMTEFDFAGLRLAELLPLFQREMMSDEEMVEYLSHCVYALNRPRQSIESLVHAFLPAKHIDHTHPDAATSIASTPRGEELTKELWGSQAIWIDYERPGFSLSKHVGEKFQKNPNARMVVMGKHGLITWGETSEACYINTVNTISEAEEFINTKRAGRKIYAAAKPIVSSAEERQQIFTQILPTLRGALSKNAPKILVVDDGEDVLEFVNCDRAAELSQIGAACPDHLLRTKRVPLFLEWKPADGVESLLEKIPTAVEKYSAEYDPYLEDYKKISGREMDPAPRVVLIPGLGMVTSSTNIEDARIVGDIYHRALKVIEAGQVLDRFTSLSVEESFSFELWPLELYKLSLKPAPSEFEGKVVVITGAADGIGRASALKFASLGAHVAILDVNFEGAKKTATEIEQSRGAGKSIAVQCDVSNEDAVIEAYKKVVLEYGGIDIVVSNAGIFRGDPVEETSLKDWNLVNNVNTTGYFLIAREAFRIWRKQNIGGNLVFIGSKNSVRAGKNGIAYGASKAAELHMARCLAEEGGDAQIRVNTVLPDAVLHGSALFTDTVKEWRANAYGIKPEELEDYYLQRCILKIPVYPEHVAEAILFLASKKSSRTTGGVINVDGGVGQAFMR